MIGHVRRIRLHNLGRPLVGPDSLEALAKTLRDRAESLHWLAGQASQRRILTVEECLAWAREAEAVACQLERLTHDV